MTKETPSISFVMAARNDDYGGNFLSRINTCLRVLSCHARNYPGIFEVVIVEYNPLATTPSLTSVLTKDIDPALPVRVITVPETLHRTIAAGSKTPFLEYVAKNIGIRRAKGEYIAATNPDIIFSAAFIDSIATRPLDPLAFYRINRHDLPAHVFTDGESPETVLAWCQQHVVRIMTNNGTLFTSWKRWIRRYLPRPTLSNIRKAPALNILTWIRASRNPNRLHTAAAGDFVMAHANAWSAVRGYDQKPFNSFVDGYHLHMLYCAGFRQEILTAPAYHIGHQTSNNTRQMLDIPGYHRDVAAMLATKVPYKQYSKDWGFPTEVFPETLVTPAA